MTISETADEKRYLDIPISKGKGSIRLFLDDIPEAQFLDIILRGAQDVLSTGLTKVVVKGLEGEELKAAQDKAMEIAEHNHELLMSGKSKLKGAKAAGKVPGKVMTEARRLAKAQVKIELKAAGYKISHIPASQITELANEYLASEDGPAIIEAAKANIEAIEAKASKASMKLAGRVKVDPKLVAAEEARASARQSAAKAKAAKARPTA